MLLTPGLTSPTHTPFLSPQIPDFLLNQTSPKLPLPWLLSHPSPTSTTQSPPQSTSSTSAMISSSTLPCCQQRGHWKHRRQAPCSQIQYLILPYSEAVKEKPFQRKSFCALDWDIQCSVSPAGLLHEQSSTMGCKWMMPAQSLRG